jgi:integrase
LLALRLEDVDFLRRTVRVEWQTTVDGKHRVLPKTPRSRRTRHTSPSGHRPQMARCSTPCMACHIAMSTTGHGSSHQRCARPACRLVRLATI